MYHVELRQFPHNTCRFNLTEQELLATVVGPWAREQWIEIGERKWSPHLARLTVLEGPQIPVGQLSMGRGWGNAQRQGEDVTERVIARAKQADGVAAGGGGRRNRTVIRAAGRARRPPGVPARGRSRGAACGLAPYRRAPPRACSERVARAGRRNALFA